MFNTTPHISKNVSVLAAELFYAIPFTVFVALPFYISVPFPCLNHPFQSSNVAEPSYVHISDSVAKLAAKFVRFIILKKLAPLFAAELLTVILLMRVTAMFNQSSQSLSTNSSLTSAYVEPSDSIANWQ
jgi:hypothetical protein